MVFFILIGLNTITDITKASWTSVGNFIGEQSIECYNLLEDDAEEFGNDHI